MAESPPSLEGGTLVPDERRELERRLGPPHQLDGSFPSLWSVELLARTVRRVAAFIPHCGWMLSYVRDVVARAYRETGFSLLDIDPKLVSVNAPAFVVNVGDAFGRFTSTQEPASAALSSVFGMALVPRFGLEAVSFGQARLDLARARYSGELARLIDWMIAEHLSASVGDDLDLGAAGYDVVHALVVPHDGYASGSGEVQIAAVTQLYHRDPWRVSAVLRRLAAGPDLYVATIAGRACMELGVVPEDALQARGVLRAAAHYGGLPEGAVLARARSITPRESPLSGAAEPRQLAAQAAVAGGKPSEAYALLTELVKAFPSHAIHWCHRGFVGELLQRPVDACRADYDQAIDLQPDYWQALINRAVLGSRHQRFDAADRDLFAARALRPDCADTLNNLLLNHWFRTLAAAPERRLSAVDAPPETPPPRDVEAKPRNTSAASDAKDEEAWKQYQILEPLGEGGMGKVFRVHHVGWGMDLALKIPRVELLQRGGVAGFIEEAEAWARLGAYPHCVDCYYVRMRRGVPWLFAELVEGGSLRDWIVDKRLYQPTEGRDVLGHMIDVALQMTYGLHHAHENGLIHQDMKPANVILGTDGVAKVTDFGLAKVTTLVDPSAHGGGAAHGGGNKTMMAGYAGMTPVYCSPEQALAARSRDQVLLTRRTDIWSWAVTVLEMFVGEIRWRSGVLAPRALAAYVEAGGCDPAIPRMPAPLIALLERCFALAPERRPESMLDLAKDLRRIYMEVTRKSQARPHPPSFDDIAVVLNNRGASMLDLSRRGDALLAWEQALEAEPLHPEATYNLALIEWRGGSITDDEAVERMTAVVAAHEESWRAHLLLAWIHFERASRKDAADSCVEVVRLLGETKGRDALGSVARVSSGLESRVVCTLSEGATAVAASRDASTVAVGYPSKTEVRDARSGAVTASHEATGEVMAVSPSGATVAIARADGIWCTGPLGTRSWLIHHVTALVFCTDTQLAAAAGMALLLIDFQSGTLREIGAHADRVTAVDTILSGKLVVSSSDDGAVVMRLLDGQVTRTLHHEQPVDWVDVTGDGGRAATGSWDAERSHYRISLWDVGASALIRRLEEPRPARGVLSEDGEYVLTWDDTGVLRVWRVADGRCLRTVKKFETAARMATSSADHVLYTDGLELGCLEVLHDAPEAPVMVARPRHSDAIEQTRALFDAALRRAHEALEQGDVEEATRHLDDARKVPGYRRHPEAQAASAKIAHNTRRGAFRNSWAGKAVRDLGGPVVAVRLLDDTVVAVVHDVGRAVLEAFEVERGSWKRRGDLRLQDAPGTLHAVAIARDAAVVATACGPTLSVWDVAAGQVSIVADGPPTVRDVALSSDGSLLFVAADDASLVWHVEKGVWLAPIAARASKLAVAVLADTLAVVSDDVLEGWSTSGRARLRRLTYEVSRIDALALTPDGSTAVTLHDNGRLAAIDAREGVPFAARQFAGAASIAVCDTGDVIAIGGKDGVVWIWDVHAKAPLRLGRHHNEVLSLAFSTDARVLVSGGRDGDVRVFHIEWGRLPCKASALHDARWWLGVFREQHRKSLNDPLQRLGESSWTRDDACALAKKLGELGFGQHSPEALVGALKPAVEADTGGPALLLVDVETGRELVVPRGRTFTLGRATRCDLVWRRPLVAPVHCRVESGDGVAQIHDEGSHVGVFVDGVRVHGSAALPPGARVRLGVCELSATFRDGVSPHQG